MGGNQMTLAQGTVNQTYVIREVEAKDSMRDFLFTLGCYSGEKVTIISKLASNFIINVKDARYSIDEGLARVIMI
jgi:Fe2+ transport system protein FeoA